MQNTLKKAFMLIGRTRNVKLKKQLTRIWICSACVAGTMNTPETIKNLQIFLPKHTKVTWLSFLKACLTWQRCCLSMELRALQNYLKVFVLGLKATIKLNLEAITNKSMRNWQPCLLLHLIKRLRNKNSCITILSCVVRSTGWYLTMVLWRWEIYSPKQWWEKTRLSGRKVLVGNLYAL